MSQNYPCVRGVPDYKNHKGLWVKSQVIGGIRYFTKASIVWQNINSRCSEAYKKKYPTYVGAENKFKDFQSFVNWCHNQSGYFKDGWHLDKDLLVQGNRVYSENTCLFVPASVNQLFSQRVNSEYPIGVSIDSRDGRIYAYWSAGGKSVNIGSFLSIEEAHKAWQIKRVSQLQGLLSNPDISSEKLLCHCIAKMRDKIQKDIDYNQETKRRNYYV